MQHRYFTEPIACRMLALIVGLIVIGAALFVTGVIIEDSGSSASATASTAHGQTSSTSHDADGGHESTSSTQKSPTAQEGVQSETVFGLNLENPWFVTAFALIWVVFMAVLIRFGRIVLPAVFLVAAVATTLDAGEVARQVGEAKSLLATMAVLVTVSHVALVVLALVVLLQGMRPRTLQPA